MHVAAVAMLVMVGLVLAFLAPQASRSSANGSPATATSISSLPFRDDAVGLPVGGDSADDPQASCATVSHAAWYSLAPEADLPVTMWAVPHGDSAGTIDVALGVWKQSADGSFTEIGCSDERGGGGAEQLVIAAGEGGSYFIQVSSTDRPEPPEGTVAFLAEVQEPAHDLFDFARPIRSTPYRDVDVDVVSARLEPGEQNPSCAAVDATTWYDVSSATDGVLAVTATPVEVDGSAMDAAISVHRGDTVESLVEIACADAEQGQSAEYLEVPIEADEDYRIQVGAVLADGAGPGVFTLDVQGIQGIDLLPLPDMVLGDAPVAITAEAGSGLPVDLLIEGPCRSLGGRLVADGAGFCTVTASQSGDSEWAPAKPVTTSLRVGRGQQAIELEPLPDAAVYGDPPFELAASSDAGLPVTFEVSGPCVVDDGSLRATGAGLCTVTASQPGDGDWIPAESATTSVRIAQGQQAIEFEALPDGVVFGDPPLDLAATSDSGLPVALEADGPCVVDDGSLRATGAGRCTVTASQPGDADWTPAEQVTSTLRIARGQQAIELEPIERARVGESTAVSASAGSGLPVTFEASGPCLVDDGLLRAIGAGRCTVTASQPGDADWVPAEPITSTLRIARGQQAIELEPIEPARVGESTAVSASADSGLPVALDANGPCLVEDGSLQAIGAGRCTVIASQPGDADWAAAEPVTTSLRIARGEQGIELQPIEDKLLGEGSIELEAEATSGLPVTFEALGPCRVMANTLTLLDAGRCTVTASQAGDADWAATEASSSFDIVAPITGPRQDFSSPALARAPGALVGDGARITTEFEPGGPQAHYYAIALAEGQAAEIGDLAPETTWSIAGPADLESEEVTWTDLEAEPDGTVAPWVAAESGIHSVRVANGGMEPDISRPYTLSLAVEPEALPVASRDELEAALMARTPSVDCQPLRAWRDPGSFEGGALAAARCHRPAKGIYEYMTYAFEGPEQLDAFHRLSLDELQEMGPSIDACNDGRPAASRWAHGDVACWVPEGDSRAVLQWTDERTNTYGVIRALDKDIARLVPVWRALRP